MILYVETSALIKILIEEEHSELAADLWDAADRRLTSRLTYPEARAALAAAERGGRISAAVHRAAKSELAGRLDELAIVEATAGVAVAAGDLAEIHSLRGYDALHLASALVPGEEDLVMATWDGGLIRAATDIPLSVATA